MQAQISIGPWALSEEAQWFENRSTARKEQDQELHEQDMAVKARRSRPRRSISLAKQGRGQKVSSIIQNDISGNSVDKDMHCERTGQNGGWEISKKKLLPLHWILCS